MFVGTSSSPTSASIPVPVPVPLIQCGWSEAELSSFLRDNKFDETVISILANQKVDGDSAQFLTLELLMSFGIVFGPATRFLSLLIKKSDSLDARDSFVSYSVQNWGVAPKLKAKRTVPPSDKELVQVVCKKRKERDEKQVLLQQKKEKRLKRDHGNIKFIDCVKKGRGWSLCVSIDGKSPVWLSRSLIPKKFAEEARNFIISNEAMLVEDPDELHDLFPTRDFGRVNDESSSDDSLVMLTPKPINL